MSSNQTKQDVDVDQENCIFLMVHVDCCIFTAVNIDHRKNAITAGAEPLNQKGSPPHHEARS